MSLTEAEVEKLRKMIAANERVTRFWKWYEENPMPSVPIGAPWRPATKMSPLRRLLFRLKMGMRS